MSEAEQEELLQREVPKRKALGDWAERCFANERPDLDKQKEEEERTWRDDQRPRLRNAALAIRCSMDELEPLKVETAPLRPLLAWF